MHDRQFPCQSQNRALAGCIRQLWRRTPHQRNHTRRVDHAALLLPVSPYTQHRMLGPKPYALDIDSLGQVPDVFGRIHGVGVACVHDARVVEHDVHPAPGVEGGYHCADGGFGTHVACVRLDSGSGIGDMGLDFSQGGGEGVGRYVGHEDVGAFACKEHGGLEADAAVRNVMVDSSADWSETLLTAIEA